MAYLLNKKCAAVGCKSTGRDGRTKLFAFPKSDNEKQRARMRSLEMSCNSLPASLILIDCGKVIGHSKVSPVPSISSGCFIESVVIHPDYRGRGLGKFLMVKTEEYIQSQGLKTAYLSTIDKQGFYSKLGYSECEKISFYGGWVNSTSPVNFRQPFHYLPKPIPSLTQKTNLNYSTPPPPPPSLIQQTFMSEKMKTSPPPPPPPLPSIKQKTFTSDTRRSSTKTYMKKNLID